MTLNHQDSQTTMMFESSSSLSTTTPVSLLSLDQHDTLSRTLERIEANNQTRNDQSLSEYEKLRARNIERNNKRMVDLGLMTEEEALFANQKAWRKTNDLEERMKFKDDNARQRTNRLSNETEINRVSNKRNKIDNDRKGKSRRGDSSTVNDAKSNSSKKEGIRTRSRVMDSASMMHSNKTMVEGSRKSSRKRARMPYEVEGIWI